MSDKILDLAVKQALQSPPQPPPPQNGGVPIQAVIAMVGCGILSPRQGYYAIFEGVQPTEYDGWVKGDDDKPQKGIQ